jgi:hypothetical protein
MSVASIVFQAPSVLYQYSSYGTTIPHAYKAQRKFGMVFYARSFLPQNVPGSLIVFIGSVKRLQSSVYLPFIVFRTTSSLQRKTLLFCMYTLTVLHGIVRTIWYHNVVGMILILKRSSMSCSQMFDRWPQTRTGNSSE